MFHMFLPPDLPCTSTSSQPRVRELPLGTLSRLPLEAPPLTSAANSERFHRLAGKRCGVRRYGMSASSNITRAANALSPVDARRPFHLSRPPVSRRYLCASPSVLTSQISSLRGSLDPFPPTVTPIFRRIDRSSPTSPKPGRCTQAPSVWRSGRRLKLGRLRRTRAEPLSPAAPPTPRGSWVLSECAARTQALGLLVATVGMGMCGSFSESGHTAGIDRARQSRHPRARARAGRKLLRPRVLRTALAEGARRRLTRWLCSGAVSLLVHCQQPRWSVEHGAFVWACIAPPLGC